jgi:spore coat polysaccharide biosynthesis protein SpsF
MSLADSATVVAIVQARMGSSRLPGKVLLNLGSRPVLDWVVTRLERASTVGAVVVATSRKPADDAIEAICRQRGWALFRGSEEDVLDRYYEASLSYPCDVVVRVTADCPLVDPGIVDEVVRAVWRSPAADYASNVIDPRTFPRGLDVEAFTPDALAAAWRQDRSGWREHVTPFLYRNPDRFRLRRVAHPEDLSRYRWTLDTPADLAALRALIAQVPEPHAPWTAYVVAAERLPHLAEKNRHVSQVIPAITDPLPAPER